MKSVDGERRPCVCCGTPTAFVRTVYGPRGARKGTERCCTTCGETGAKAA